MRNPLQKYKFVAKHENFIYLNSMNAFSGI